MRDRRKPARLQKKPEAPIVPPGLIVFIMFMVLFILAIAFAWTSKSFYYYNL